MQVLVLLLVAAMAGRVGAVTGDSWQLFDDSQVARFYVTVDPAALQWMYENPASDSMHLAQLHAANAWFDEDVPDVGLRLRGNTSRYAQKKSFKLSFNDFVDGREFHDVDKLNLNGEHNDPAIVRSKLCFDLFQRVGKIASRASHGELWINGNYHGLYANVEHVDDEFLWKHFAHDGGNLWKCLWPADLVWRGSSPEDYKHEQDGRRVYELTTNEETDDYRALQRLIRILHSTSEASIEDSLGDYLDVPGVLEYFAVNVLVGGWDDYWYLQNNFYLYHDPVDDRMTLIPYDYDNTFGVDWFSVDWATRNPYTFGSSGRPLATRILNRPRWRNLFTHMLEHHLSHSMQAARWESRLDSLWSLCRPSAVADSFRTLDYGFTVEDYDASWTGPYLNQHVKRGILEFVQARASSLPAQLTWVDAGPVVHQVRARSQSLAPGDSLRVDAAAFAHGEGLQLRLRWRLEGDSQWQVSDMAFTGDATSPVLRDADRWSIALPPQDPGAVVEFQAEALDGEGRSHRLPPVRPLRAAWREASPLVLNEFLALNENGISDPSGEREDWLELYNAGTEAIALAGLHLSDDAGDPTNWAFPSETPPLPAGEFLLVWADNDLDQPGLHAGFRLSGDGEMVVLASADGLSILDSLSFGPQQDDVSMGRVPDGSGPWLPQTTPTPGGSNDGTAVDPRGPLPLAFTLSARPNPFNGSLLVEVAGTEGPATVELFNIAGQRILKRDLLPGVRILRLEASELGAQSSGYLVLRVSQGEESRSLRLLHVK
jgi:hypothetical protein